MDTITLGPISSVKGRASVPGSKSYANRYLLLAALTEGQVTVSGLPEAQDIHVMIGALRSLGRKVEYNSRRNQCKIVGSRRIWRSSGKPVMLGNAGTAMRPLCAAIALSLREGEIILDGDPRMRERPIGDLVNALRSLGADITYLAASGFPPLQIRPILSATVAECVRVSGDTSSQFLSSLLMAAPLLAHGLTIEVAGELVSRPYVDLTIAAMKKFGLTVLRKHDREYYVPPQTHSMAPRELRVVGDVSSASYLLAAGAVGGGPVRVSNLAPTDYTQGDLRFVDVIERMGATVVRGDNWIEVSGDVAALKGLDMDFGDMPDGAMTVAALGLFANGTTTVRGIGNWRFKETDRLAAMSNELRKLGASVLTGSDFISVTRPKKILPAIVETYNDHRMAMCLSLAMFSPAGVKIRNPNCCSKTFPQFFEVLHSLMHPSSTC